MNKRRRPGDNLNEQYYDSKHFGEFKHGKHRLGSNVCPDSHLLIIFMSVLLITLLTVLYCIFMLYIA